MINTALLRRPPSQSPTGRAADKLWGGYSKYAKDDLRQIVSSSSNPAQERAKAAWELARWYAYQDDAEETLSCLRLIPTLDGSSRLARGKLLLEVSALMTLGRRAEAQIIASAALRRFDDDPDIPMMAANTLIETGSSSSDERRLALVNELYTRKGLLSIRKIDSSRGLSLDNITAAAASAPVVPDGPTVSVLMPAYNVAATIGFALRSVQEQTWRNLEIIVVDDASTDETVAVASEAARNDERISIVRLDRNHGTYVASNKGLELATGEYVTTHGADDWSHPQKIEQQVRAPLGGDFVASMSYLVRSSLNLRFNGSWRPNETLLEVNLSSYMIKTALLRELGGWDPVRTSADRELTRRLEAKLGSPSVRLVQKDIPLSFALDGETSLTRDPATHVSSVFYGTISAYLSSSRRWHALASRTGDFHIEPDPNSPRKFMAPTPMLSERVTPRPYDVVLIADFGVTDEAFEVAYEHLVEALESGLRVAIFHWPRYENAPSDIDGRLHTLIDHYQIDQLMPEQTLKAERLVIYSPGVLLHLLDQVPKIDANRIHVVVDRMAEADAADGASQYDQETIRTNLEVLFGSEGEWWPISSGIRELIAADPRYPEPPEQTWMPKD